MTLEEMAEFELGLEAATERYGLDCNPYIGEPSELQYLKIAWDMGWNAFFSPMQKTSWNRTDLASDSQFRIKAQRIRINRMK